VRKGFDYCNGQSGLENGLTLSEGDWLVKEGEEISVYDANLQKNFEAKDA
jgi:hypothetical protein